MVFKTVDGQLTSIFSKVEKINTGFNLTGNEIQKYIDKFNKFNLTQSFGNDYTAFLDKVSNKNLNVSLMFEELAKQGASAKASIQGVYAAILDGNTTGISNIKSVISAFNQIDPTNQQAFASAVGQTNAQLGSYLGGLNGAKASMLGYATETTIATAKTMALRAATMALNTALTWGLSVVISGVINLISEAIVTQKELAEQAKETAAKADEQAKVFSKLKDQYLEILDSTDDEAVKTEKLNEWKNTLIETYGLEKEALENLNTEREKGIELIEQESKANVKSTYQDYLVKNKKEIEKANKKLGQSGEFNIFTGSQIDIDKSGNYGVSDSLKKYFNIESGYYFGNLTNKLEINYDDAVDEFSKLKEIQNELNDIEAERKVFGKGLTEDEKLIRQYIDGEIDRIEKLNEQYLTTYQTSGEYGAWVKFFTENNQTALKEAGEDNYLTWREGFLNQAESASEKREMENILAKNVPDLEDIYNKSITRNNNLDLAKSKFGISDTINSASEGLKLAFINSLDDTDLDILVNKIKNPFAKGIEGAKQAIADFKKDPNNSISVSTDTKSIDDMLKAVEDYSKSANTYVKNQKTVTDALSEQAKYGKLASDTVIELSDAGYSSALVYDKVTGAITLNEQAVKNLNLQKQSELKLDLIKEKSEVEQKYKDEASSVADLQREMATANEIRREAIRLEIAEKSANMAEYYEMMSRYESLINSISNYTPTQSDSSSSSTKSSDPWKDEFEKLYSEKQHLLTMNQITEEEYINWLDDAYKHYFSDLTKYQDEYWKYEEEVYKFRTENEQNLFDKKIDNLETLADKALNVLVDADGNKLELFVSFDYAREQLNAAISAIQNRIDDIRAGIISGTDDDISELEEKINSLTDKLKDIDEKEITSERDFLKNKKDEYSDYYDGQIDKLKEQQKEAENLAKKEKSAIQEKIDLLEEMNSKKEEEIDLEKKKQAIEEAKSQRTIARINENGTTSYIADREKIKSAQEEYDKAQYEYQKSLLEAQIEAIETASDTVSEKYDKQIDILEQQKQSIEDKFDILINQLEDYLNPDTQTQSNSAVWDLIAKTTGLIYENGVWSDKDGNSIDINSLIDGVNNLAELEKENSNVPQKNTTTGNKAQTENKSQFAVMAEYFQSMGMKDVTAEKLERYSASLINNGLTFQNSMPFNSDETASKAIAYNNSNHTENISYSFTGDIVINNPVGNVDDLANEIIKSGATVFNQQIHTNRK